MQANSPTGGHRFFVEERAIADFRCKHCGAEGKLRPLADDGDTRPSMRGASGLG